MQKIPNSFRVVRNYIWIRDYNPPKVFPEENLWQG
jgi:hypothetical protein